MAAVMLNGVVAVWLHSLLTSTPYGNEWSPSRPSHFITRERAFGVYDIEGWGGGGGPRFCTDGLEGR